MVGFFTKLEIAIAQFFIVCILHLNRGKASSVFAHASASLPGNKGEGGWFGRGEEMGVLLSHLCTV